MSGRSKGPGDRTLGRFSGFAPLALACFVSLGFTSIAQAACSDPAEIRVQWQNCDKSGADLTNANLSGAKLEGTDLRKADLTKTDLSGADLTMADLTGAILKGADLSGAAWKDGRICAEGSIGECKFKSSTEPAADALADSGVSNEIQSAAVTESEAVPRLDVVTTHSNGLDQALKGNANAPTARGTLTISFCPDNTLRDDRNCADEPADGSGGPETASGPLPGLEGSTPDNTRSAGPEAEPVEPSAATVIVTVSPRALGAGRQSREGVPIPYGPETLSASGGTPPYLFSLEDGTLPKGVELSSAGLLNGFAEQAGTFPIKVAARDANGVIGQRSYEINIRIPGTIIAPISVGTLTIGLPQTQSRLTCDPRNAKLSVTPETLPVAMVGEPYGPVDLIIVGGESPYSLRSAESFGLPAGLQVVEIPDDTSGDGSTFQRGLRISGVPEQVRKTGETGIELTVLDTCMGFIGAKRVIEILAPLSTTPDNLPDGTVGVDYGPVDVMISGGKAPYTVAFTPGVLPDGLTVTTLADDTGGVPAEFHKGVRISGVPTEVSDGGTVLLLAITDAAGYKLARPYTVAIVDSPVPQDPMTMTPDTLPDGIAGSEYGPVDLVLKGGTPPYYFVSNSGKMDSGLTLNQLEDGSGLRLTGVPKDSGSFENEIALNAVDKLGVPFSRTYALQINAALCPLPGMMASFNSDSTEQCQCKPTLYPFEQGNGCGPCADGQKPFGGTCPAPVKTFVPTPVETKASCSGGMVLKSSGVCGCPSAKPTIVNGVCKAPLPPPKKKAPSPQKKTPSVKKSAPKPQAPAAPRAPAASAPAPRECNVFVLALQCGLIDRTSNVGTCSCGGPLPSNNPAPQRAPAPQRPAAPQGPTCEQNCANQFGFGTEGHEICMMNQC